jgi:hypothetical protein
MRRAGGAVAATICLAIAATGCGGDDTPSSGTAAPGTAPVGSYGAGWSDIGAGVGDVGFVAVETAIFGPCVGVVFVSADGVAWQRALNPWPPPAMGQPVVSGDSIVIPAGECGSSADRRWIGAVR